MVSSIPHELPSLTAVVLSVLENGRGQGIRGHIITSANEVGEVLFFAPACLFVCLVVCL